MKEIEEIKPFNLKRNISGGIDATINHSVYGEIPTTLEGEQLEKAEAGEFGEVLPLTESDNERIAQIKQEDIIKKAEKVFYKYSWMMERKVRTGKDIPEYALQEMEQAALDIEEARVSIV
jgi:hypothetical protein